MQGAYQLEKPYVTRSLAFAAGGWDAGGQLGLNVKRSQRHDVKLGAVLSLKEYADGTGPGMLDGLLRLERRLPPGSSRADVRRQVAEVIGAARDVQAAAVRAGSDATEPQVRSLVRHARDEVDIVATALATMRSTARPH